MQTEFFSTLTGQIVLALVTSIIGAVIYEVLKSAYGKVNRSSKRGNINYIKNTFREITYYILLPDLHTNFLIKRILYCVMSLGAISFGIVAYLIIHDTAVDDKSFSNPGYWISNLGCGAFINISVRYWITSRRMNKYEDYYNKSIKRLKRYNASDADIQCIDKLYNEYLDMVKRISSVKT